MTTTRKNVLHKNLYLLLLVAICFVLFAGCGKNKEPEITAEFLGSKLEPMSELVSAKMTYNGVIHYSDGNVPFLTQKEFLMVYRAQIKAGIDLSKIEINVTDTNVTISIPKDVSLDIAVDPDSITFYTEKTAIFNREKKEDALDAIHAAEEHALEYGGIEELKSTARKEAALLITGLVEPLIGERTLTVVS